MTYDTIKYAYVLGKCYFWRTWNSGTWQQPVDEDHLVHLLFSMTSLDAEIEIFEIQALNTFKDRDTATSLVNLLWFFNSVCGD